MYILFKDNKLTECENLMAVADNLDISITDKGEVLFNGEKDTITYKMNEFTKDEVRKDFVRSRLSSLQHRFNIKIYRVLDF